MSSAFAARHHHHLFLAAGAVAIASAAGAAHAQVASALIREGAALPGDPSGQAIFSINSAAVNHNGGYAFQVNVGAGAATAHTWGHATGGPGTVLRTEGTYGIYTQTGFEAQIGLSDAGASCYSPTVTPGGDSIWLDSTPVAVDGTAHPTLPGMFWTFCSRVGVTGNGIPHFAGGVAATAGGATTNRGLFSGINGGTVLLLGGQIPPNCPRALDGALSLAFENRFSANGTNYITPIVMVAPAADNGVMIVNGSGLLAGGSLVQEANPIPASVGGMPGENWALFGVCGINEAGDYFFTGDSNLATTADEFIFKNGQMLYRDGMVLDGQTLQGDIELAFMNENGDIAFVWDVAANTLEALYFNDNLLLMEGDTVDLDNNGIAEPNSVVRGFSGTSALAISDRSGGVVKVYFTADIDTLGTPSTTDDIEGAFVITVPLPVCLADIDGGGSVEINDLLEVINNWGSCPAPCPPNCPQDISGLAGPDCQINIDDLLEVINNWGPCP